MSAAAVPVGIVGAGYFGGQHARAIAALGGRLRVAAVASRTLAAASSLAGPGVRAYDDWRRLVEDRDVAAVCICTPHDLHEPVAVAAAQAGKAVLLEKPMATSVVECDRIIAAAARVPFMVAQPSRYMPAFALARRVIADGRIGDPVHVRSPMIKAWLRDKRRPWHLDSARGGGMWMTNGIHMVDRLCFLLGARPRAVSASIGTQLHAAMAVDDIGVALYTFSGGRSGLVEAIGYAEGAPDHDCIVHGTKGMLRCHHADGLALGQGERWTHIGARAENWVLDTLTGLWRDFLAHVDGAPSPIPGEEGRAHLAAVLAARDAAAEGRTITLTTDGTSP
ncbi:MAG: Gfo/Idh/MocA family oxidoreductase [Alphaproteobacteria bacterium]|nr:Gfo/Idh/MocA family oxidoreductase [Alphaproteobacteria bacterium]